MIQLDSRMDNFLQKRESSVLRQKRILCISTDRRIHKKCDLYVRSLTCSGKETSWTKQKTGRKMTSNTNIAGTPVICICCLKRKKDTKKQKLLETLQGCFLGATKEQLELWYTQKAGELKSEGNIL